MTAVTNGPEPTMATGLSNTPLPRDKPLMNISLAKQILLLGCSIFHVNLDAEQPLEIALGESNHFRATYIGAREFYYYY